MADSGLSRNKHLAPHVTTFLLRRELILEMHAGRTGLNHSFHDLEDVERAAKAGFGVGNDGGEPVGTFLALGMLDLVGPLQRLVDALYYVWHTIRRIEALVGVHLPGQVRIRRYLPATEIDGFEARLHLLHGLVACQSTERRHVRLAMEQIPETLGPQARQCVFNLNRTAQTQHILSAIRTFDPLPAWIGFPLHSQLGCLVMAVHHDVHSPFTAMILARLLSDLLD